MLIATSPLCGHSWVATICCEAAAANAASFAVKNAAVAVSSETAYDVLLSLHDVAGYALILVDRRRRRPGRKVAGGGAACAALCHDECLHRLRRHFFFFFFL